MRVRLDEANSVGGGPSAIPQHGGAHGHYLARLRNGVKVLQLMKRMELSAQYAPLRPRPANEPRAASELPAHRTTTSSDCYTHAHRAALCLLHFCPTSYAQVPTHQAE